MLQDLRAALERSLPPRLNDALRHAVAVVGTMGLPCYLVGGPVRDLLLGRPVDDLDLVVEGDAIAVAERFATEYGGAITRHDAFGTAKVRLEGESSGLHVDFVTARSEYYPAPAALPVVRPAGIVEDLRRRDFTINTLAIGLHAAAVFELLDPFGGLGDIERGLIRVLHDRSFVDDPTRILRAARFAARLHFMIEPGTRQQAAAATALGMFERITPVRILNEVWLAFREPAPAAVLELLDQLGVLERILPGLRWTTRLAELIQAACAAATSDEERRALILGAIAWSMPEPTRKALLDRYPLAAPERRVVEGMSALQAVVAMIETSELRPSELDRLLGGLDPAVVLVGDLVAPAPARATLAHYRLDLRPTHTLLNGDDLRALGIPPGPLYRSLLADIRAAQLDGQVTTRAEAEAWVLHSAAARQDEQPVHQRRARQQDGAG